MLIVVKIGGSTLGEGGTPELFSDIKKVLASHRLVLVHGGGDEVTEIATKMGKEQKFVTSPEGFKSRYTDRETAEIYMMVMSGRVNKLLACALLKTGIPVVGLSGIDGQLIMAERKKKLIIIDERGKKRAIDGGYTGKISAVNAKIIDHLLQQGHVPLISPVAIGQEYEPLNVDGDRAAAYVAGSIMADRLVLLTDVEGLILDGKLVDRISTSQVKELLPKIGPGMITKIFASREALSMGVGEVTITSGFRQEPVTSAIEHRAGTVIYNG